MLSANSVRDRRRKRAIQLPFTELGLPNASVFYIKTGHFAQVFRRTPAAAISPSKYDIKSKPWGGRLCLSSSPPSRGLGHTAQEEPSPSSEGPVSAAEDCGESCAACWSGLSAGDADCAGGVGPGGACSEGCSASAAISSSCSGAASSPCSARRCCSASSI